MHELNTTIIGDSIRKQREKLNINCERLAEMLGITGKFCGNIESGARGVTLKTLIAISDCLNMSTDYILFGNTSKTSDQVFLRAISLCPDSKKFICSQQ